MVMCFVLILKDRHNKDFVIAVCFYMSYLFNISTRLNGARCTFNHSGKYLTVSSFKSDRDT